MPLFLSAETIRAELAQRIQAATGRATRIDGPVSFSVFPTARLSAEGIGIAGLDSDTEAFSVESVTFGLSLLPLVTGNIEIYGVTITRPSILIATEESGRTNWSVVEAEPSPPASIEEMIATTPEESAPSGALAALDRLSIGRVTIVDGTLTWRDAASGREEKVEAANLDIRVPKLDGAGTVEGSFSRRGVVQTLKLDIGERPDPTRFESVPIALMLGSDAAAVTATGTALAGETYFSGTIETSGSSLVAFAEMFGAELPDAPAFGKFQTSARIDVSASQIRIEKYVVELGGIKAQGGAAIGLDRTRPGIGLKIEAERVDTALFVGRGQAGGAPSGSPAGGGGEDESIDLSALGLVDANIDFSAKELLIGAVPVTNLGLDIQVAGGGLNASIRSATVNGAPGRGALVVDNSGAEPAISGTVEMNGLDAAGLVVLSGMDLPIDAGSVGLDVAFKTRGATKDALVANLDGSGRISLVNGHASQIGIAATIGGDSAADEIDDIDIVAEFSSLATPVTAKGGLGWKGERFDVSARGEPRSLATGKTSPVAIEAASDRVKFGFNGEASLSGLGAGSVKLSTPSLRNILAWIGRPIASGGGLGTFSIEGTVKLAEDSFSFEETTFTLDGSRGAGRGKVTFGDDTPTVTAGLAMTTLDVTPYLVASGASKGGAATGGSAASAGAGWSSDPIAFDGLRAVNANLNFKAQEILADKLRIGPANLIVSLADGRLSAELADMALYSGTGAGTLSIDGAAETPSISVSFRLLEIQALPFLTDTLGFTRVEGRGSFAFDLGATGASEAALVAALDGNGTIYVQNGAIRGINIPKMVRTLSVETLLGWQQASGEKTDFTELSGSFTIDKGILANDDLVMVGPLLRVTGAGRVDIPKQTLGYRVDPKIVASLEGQGGGSGDLEGFAVPIRVEGSWGRPRIYPEIEGILQDPKGALDQLRKLGGGLFGGGAAPGGEASKGAGDELMDGATKGLEQLLGGSGGTAAPEEAPPPTEPPPIPPPAPAPADQPTVSDQPPADLAPAAPDTAAPPAETPPPDTPPAETLPPAGPPATDPPPDPAAAPSTDPAGNLLKTLLGQ